jgi:3-methyladenine DNA glycosylase AlkD
MTQLPDVKTLVSELRKHGSPEGIAGQQRYGINGREMLGVSIYEIRKIAKGIHDHDIALELWATEIHDARLMACFVDIPEKVTRPQMDDWAEDFDTWDLCDQATTSLFDLTPHAVPAIYTWAPREEEFVRRAAFATMAGLAWHSRTLEDSEFTAFFDLIRQYSTDPRNYVKKGVNWALRNIGKRNDYLLEASALCAQDLLETGDRTARWIAKDALREFEVRRLKKITRKSKE